MAITRAQARPPYDAARTTWLQPTGYPVMRISNRDLTLDRLGKLIGRIPRRAGYRV